MRWIPAYYAIVRKKSLFHWGRMVKPLDVDEASGDGFSVRTRLKSFHPRARLLSGVLLSESSSVGGSMFRSSLLTLIILVGSIAARAQVGSIPTPALGTDPLALGKQALVNGDFKAAQEFFSNYLKEHPENTEAIFYAGNSALELRQ